MATVKCVRSGTVLSFFTGAVPVRSPLLVSCLPVAVASSSQTNTADLAMPDDLITLRTTDKAEARRKEKFFRSFKCYNTQRKETAKKVPKSVSVCSGVRRGLVAVRRRQTK